MEKQEYTLKRSKRKSVAIIIERNGKVLVKAPSWLPLYRIDKFVQEKADWIKRKQEEVASMEQIETAHSYETGDTFLFDGQEYTLIIVQEDRNGSTVEKDSAGQKILVSGHDMEPQKVRLVLEGFYRKQAEEVFRDRVKYWHFVLEQHTKNGDRIELGKIAVRNQKTRWGSCSSKGNINFNWRLLMAPGKVLDYVVVHELCHLVYMNHSGAFWGLVEELLPDYGERRRWLKENSRLLRWEE